MRNCRAATRQPSRPSWLPRAGWWSVATTNAAAAATPPPSAGLSAAGGPSPSSQPHLPSDPDQLVGHVLAHSAAAPVAATIVSICTAPGFPPFF